MREIKFRGMNPNGEWLYGDLIHRDGLSTIVPADCYESVEDSFVMTSTVGQYIGLKDLHGNEIYDGDIVECYAGEHYQGCWEYQKRVIVEYCWTQSMWEMLNCDQLEVIGNIYEHPERIPEVTSHDQ